jgi:DNA polymerase-3 subunit epsilon
VRYSFGVRSILDDDLHHDLHEDLDDYQSSFDDPTTPLHQVTFCVVDLETTGGSAAADAITEVGAVKVRGGEVLGTFQTLVRAEQPVFPAVSLLTGITDDMLIDAPPLAAVLPMLVEFIGGSVIVGHNVRFDVSFLDAAFWADERPLVGQHQVDTVALARRLLREDVDNCKLGTLARRFDLDHQPSHRALDDALATVDLLHVLLERSAGFGVQALDDLLALPKVTAHPQAAKLRLTARLPRSAGVFVFHDAQGQPIFVDAADDVRSHVRAFFASKDRRRIGPMLRELHSIELHRCSSPVEAAGLATRLRADLNPRYNRPPRRKRSPATTAG